MVGSRDSNPDLHGLNVPRLPIAPRAEMVTTGGFEPPLDRLSTCCLCRLGYMVIGPSGWTRTTTSRVKSPACCVDTTEGDQLGANDGIRTRTSRLGRPAGDRYPTFALDRPTVSNPSLHAGNVECNLHTQAEHGPVSLTGPSTFVSFQRPRSFELVAWQGIRTRTRELWRLGCSRYTTLPASSHVPAISKTNPPCDLARVLFRARGQNKKGLLGDRPRRPGSR